MCAYVWRQMIYSYMNEGGSLEQHEDVAVTAIYCCLASRSLFLPSRVKANC